MTDQALRDTLTAASRGTSRNAALVGFGTLGMGGLSGLCGLLRLDPDMRHWKMMMWAAYAGMTLFFLGVGVLMIGSALFILPRKGNDLVDRVFNRPDTVARVWLLLIKSKYNPNDQAGQLGVATSLCLDTTDGVHHQITVRGAEAETILAAIVARAPNAKVGPP